METILHEEILDVKGTTKLTIGDPMYLDAIANNTCTGDEKHLVFDGNISAAPMGKMKLQKIHGKENGIEYDMINVTVFQAARPPIMNTYLKDMHYPDAIKKDIDLGCDTASFTIETKYGYDEFHTGADGFYGHIYQYKQYYGMKLELSFDEDLFDFDEIKRRMLALFPESKKGTK